MPSARRRDSVDSEMEDVTNNNEVSEGEEGEEEEYEIEAILDAKNGAFPEGKLGYLVKWKGYNDEHNSWVNEDDAANARDLIQAYWLRQAGKGGSKGRKSDAKPSASASSKKRKSPAIIQDDSDAEQPAPPPPAKKRGRPPKNASISDDESEKANGTKAKKNRKSTGPSKKAAPASIIMDDEEEDAAPEEGFVSMKKWQNASSWAHLVDHIETVERTADGNLKVYFQLKNSAGGDGGLCCEDSKLCKEKMPQLLLDFYESNLRWRSTE